MNRDVYKHLLHTYGRRLGFWTGVVAEVIRTLINRIYVVILLAGLAAAISTGNTHQAKHLVLIYLIVSLIAAVVGGAGELVGVITENKVYEQLMSSYYQKLVNKDMSFYRDSRTGYLTSIFRQYLDSALLLVRLFRSDFVRVFISLTAPVVVLYTQSWKVGTLALVVVISQIVYMVWASAKANGYRERSNETYRQISGEVADDVANIVAYKSAGKEAVATERMRQLANEEARVFTLRRRTNIALDFPRNVVTFGLSALAFLMVVNNSPNAGDSIKLLVLTLTYIFQILRNVGDLPDLIDRHDDLATKIYPTLATLQSTDEAIKDPQNPKPFKPTKAEIVIDNMSFKYQDNSAAKYIFKDLNLTIKGGEHVGIVGLSGAGKSTLASLLMRFDDVSQGSIKVDGTDIRDVAQSSLRRNIAYVPQEPILFHRSIKENIAYHNNQASQKDVERAAKAAHAHQFIKDLPDGYQTIVGERGVKLSGGQKQRVVIARAVLKNAPIVLFDEATSALDSESEHIIQQALPQIIGKHTAIIIAHRLSTVAGLDRIIVMHDGVIEEEGTHQQLLAKKGRYHSLWQRQTNQK